MPSASLDAKAVVTRAAHSISSGEDGWYRQCLKWTRVQWNLPAKYATAMDAWRGSKDKHAYNGDPFSIPYGAPVFSVRPGAGPDDAGHVFIACGVYRDKAGKRHRVFRGIDLKSPGEACSFELSALVERWGHKILGWTGDLNGYDLDLENKVRA